MSKTPIQKSRLLDVPQAAEYLAFTERHLRRLVNERRITHVKDVKLLRFDTRDLDAWVEAHRREAIES